LLVLLHVVSRHMHGGRYILAEAVRAKHPAFVLVPIAPKSMRWSSLDGSMSDATPLAVDAVHEVQRRHSIDSSRIYISGYSMGGVGTFAMLEKYPDLFAAALALCGGWDASRAWRFPDDVPVLAAHGSEDHPESSRAMISALAQDGKEAYYREYPGVGHNVWDYAYRDPANWDWLFAQRRETAN